MKKSKPLFWTLSLFVSLALLGSNDSEDTNNGNSDSGPSDDASSGNGDGGIPGISTCGENGTCCSEANWAAVHRTDYEYGSNRATSPTTMWPGPAL